ncbi:MAG: aspartate carbamoyltransferase [Nitrososphaerota archaeon]
MANPFYKRDVISIKDFTREEFERLFTTVGKLERMDVKERRRLGEDRVLALLFFEPSTRPRLRFEAGLYYIGGHTIGFAEPRMASIEKGENLTDTLKTVEGYSDIIVIRHPLEGAARFAAEISDKPIINAGSGGEEHPTQAMLDLYTMMKETGRIDGLKVAVVGDLKYSRTAHSLLYALAKYSLQVWLVSPPQLRVRKEILFDIKGSLQVKEAERVEEIIEELDVVYVTRIQKERFPDPAEYEKVKGSYVIDGSVLKRAKEDLIILHPLPRVDEVKPEVDSTRHARYFRQAHYGKLVRAALLALILNEDVP